MRKALLEYNGVKQSAENVLASLRTQLKEPELSFLTIPVEKLNGKRIKILLSYKKRKAYKDHGIAKIIVKDAREK